MPPGSAFQTQAMVGESAVEQSQAARGFFVLGVACSVGWSAVSSELARFAASFGSGVLLQLNLAFYLPSVPLLLLQAALDRRIDACFGHLRSNVFRVTAGFGGCAAVLAAFPHLQDSLAQVLGAVAALGITSSIAFGTSYQLVSGYGSSSTVGLTIGYVCSPPLVLLFEAALRLGPRCQWHEMRRLYGLVAAVPAVGLAVAVALLLQRRKADQRRQQQAQQLQPRHREQQLADSQEPLLQSASESGELSVLLDGGDGGGSGTVFAVWPAAASLALSIACSMFLFPFFTHFTSAGQFGMLLPVVLFWVRCFADILGRLLPKALPQPAPPLLLGLAALRLALLPLALMYIHGSLPALHSDFLLAAYVALQWLLSGAINAWSYLSVPRLVPPSLAAPAAAVISVTFNVACLAGLLLAIPFEALF